MTPRIHLLTFILFSYFATCWCTSKPQSINSVFTEFSEATLAEDGKLNFTQLASKYGHCADQYDVTTEDGYILTMFHLGDENGPSVLLFHGLEDSCYTYIIRGNTSLAITLANAGYSVWVGNNRGTQFGRSHTTLDPDTDDKFWDYSMQEFGHYDLAASIDFICDKTGEESIATIGHSLGTAMHYILGSTRPEYNAKVKVTISLAPIAFLNNITPPLSLGFPAYPEIILLLKSLGINELLRNHGAAKDLIEMVCSKAIINDVACRFGFLAIFSGFDPNNVESDFLKVLFGHYPSATSRKSLSHFGQLHNRGRFSQYDYGPVKNLIEYGTENPPDYDLSAVKMPVVLLAGANDQVAKVKDAEHLRDCLPNVHYEVINYTAWTHFDFVWGKHMPEYLYPTIFKILKEHI